MTQLNTSVPDALQFYQPSRSTYAISFRVSPVVSEDITSMQSELWIDTSPTFDSVNLKKYTETSPELSQFQNGHFFKSYVFPIPNLFEDVNFFAQVRINSALYISAWSVTEPFTIPASTWWQDTALLVGLLPDDQVYTKQGITLSGKIIESTARQIQDMKAEANQVKNNVNYYLTQDQDLFDILGTLLQVFRDTSRPFIEYRRQLLEFWEAFLVAGTEEAISKVITALLGQSPDFIYKKNNFGWIIHSNQVLPYTIPPTTEHIDPSQHYFIRSPNTAYPTLGPIATPYSRYGKALSVTVKIYNPFNLPTNHVLIETLVGKIKPINVTIQYIYWAYSGGQWVQYIPGQ